MINPDILPDAQFDVFSNYRSHGWEEYKFSGELMYMRKDVSTAPSFRSYKYIYITPKGETRSWKK